MNGWRNNFQRSSILNPSQGQAWRGKAIGLIGKVKVITCLIAMNVSAPGNSLTGTLVSEKYGDVLNGDNKDFINYGISVTVHLLICHVKLQN